jgi:hypothetical protein
MVKLKRVYESANGSSLLNFLKEKTYLRIEVFQSGSGKTETKIGVSSSLLPSVIDFVSKSIIDSVKQKGLSFDGTVGLTLYFPTGSKYSSGREYGISFTFGSRGYMEYKVALGDIYPSIDIIKNDPRMGRLEGYELEHFLHAYNMDNENAPIDEDDIEKVYLPYFEECVSRMDKLVDSLANKASINKILEMVCKDNAVKSLMSNRVRQNLSDLEIELKKIKDYTFSIFSDEYGIDERVKCGDIRKVKELISSIPERIGSAIYDRYEYDTGEWNIEENGDLSFSIQSPNDEIVDLGIYIDVEGDVDNFTFSSYDYGNGSVNKGDITVSYQGNDIEENTFTEEYLGERIESIIQEIYSQYCKDDGYSWREEGG